MAHDITHMPNGYSLFKNKSTVWYKKHSEKKFLGTVILMGNW